LFEGIHHLKDELGREVVLLFEIEDGLESRTLLPAVL